jgi:hypothetical protein
MDHFSHMRPYASAGRARNLHRKGGAAAMREPVDEAEAYLMEHRLPPAAERWESLIRTEVGITPVPVDRAPFPLPKLIQIPLYSSMFKCSHSLLPPLVGFFREISKGLSWTMGVRSCQ